jgi:hypothetical protein
MREVYRQRGRQGDPTHGGAKQERMLMIHEISIFSAQEKLKEIQCAAWRGRRGSAWQRGCIDTQHLHCRQHLRIPTAVPEDDVSGVGRVNLCHMD